MTITIYPNRTNISSDAIINAGNSTTTPLAGGGTFTGSAIDMLKYSTLRVSLYADAPSATDGFKIQFSNDGVNWDFVHASTYADAGLTEDAVFNRAARYARVFYTNGGTPQGVMRMQTMVVPSSTEFNRHFIGEVPIDSDTGILTQSAIVGKTTGGGGGYVPVKVNPSGALAADVSGSSVIVSGAVSVSNTVNATVAETDVDITPIPSALKVNTSGDLMVALDIEAELMELLRSTNRTLKQLLIVMASATNHEIPSDNLDKYDVD